MQIIKEMLIKDLITNDGEPRSWEWRFPHLIDMDTYKEDRFICTPERYPWTKVMYSEGIRAKNFERAVRRVEENDMDEVRQFRPIIIDEMGMVISGMKVLQIHKCAGKKSVEVGQIFGLEFWEKVEMMMADSDNFQQHNWTPKLPRLRHKKVPHFREN
jgi:hypothetical protein